MSPACKAHSCFWRSSSLRIWGRARNFAHPGQAANSESLASTGVQAAKFPISVPVEPTCLELLAVSVIHQFPGMVEYIKNGCIRFRIRRGLHSFWKLLKLGWPEECGDLLLKISVMNNSTNWARSAGSAQWMTRDLVPFWMVWKVEHEAINMGTPVQTQVQLLVTEKLIGWLNLTQAPLAAYKYLPRLFQYVHSRLRTLESHCAVCDRNSQRIGEWFLSLCKSGKCIIAMEALLTVYLHPKSVLLLISFVVAAIGAPNRRKGLIFGDSLTLNDRYWLRGMLQGNEPDWVRISEELQKAPKFEDLALWASSAPQSDDLDLSATSVRNWLRHDDPVLLRLINWLLLTFDGVLLPLARKHLSWLPRTIDLFLVQAGNRERAVAFRQRKDAAGGRSFFAFHGSGSFNWHSIVRHDLRKASGTALEENGKIFGHGIYVSLDWTVATRYSECHFPGFKCLGLCEVVDTDRVLRTPLGHFVVQDEHDVTIRALLVTLAGHWNINPATFGEQMGNGRALATGLGDLLRRTKEYQDLLTGQ